MIKYIYPLSKVYIMGRMTRRSSPRRKRRLGRISKLIHPHVANATGGEYDALLLYNEVTDSQTGGKG